MKISNYGTVIIDDKEISFDKFIKSFSDYTFDTRWIDYDQENQLFKVCLDGKKIVNLELPDNGDKYVYKQIMDIVNKYKVYLIKKSINEKVMKTGAFPTDKTEIAYYEEFLEKELNDSKAMLISNGILFSLPFVFASLTYFIGKDFVNDWTSNYNPSIFHLFKNFFATGVFGGLTIASSPLLFESDLKENYEDYKLTKKKLKAFKNYVNDLNANQSFEEFLQEEDKKDNTNVDKNKSRFFEEYNLIISLLEKLPIESQKKYRIRLSKILKDYQKQVNDLFSKNKGKIVLGEAEDVWQIFIDLLPELNKLYLDIKDEVDTMEKKDSFNMEIEELQQMLTRGYTDEATESSYKKVG